MSGRSNAVSPSNKDCFISIQFGFVVNVMNKSGFPLHRTKAIAS